MVACGAPSGRAFPPPTPWWLRLVYRFWPWLADACAALPGRRSGFGGNEARGLIRDWSRTALSGRYAATGIGTDLEAAMDSIEIPVRAAVMRDDWLAPESSLRFLLSKLPRSPVERITMDAATLGAKADHFAWIRAPRSEEHTSELQSLMRISYAVFCLKKKIIHMYRSVTNSPIYSTTTR